MDCKRYQNWLSDAALGALDRSRESELRAHVDDCAGCRAALERERMLVAAIDRGVAAHLAAEPSADFAARLKMRLAEEAAGRPARAEAGPRSGWLWGFWPELALSRWIPAAALALIAATIGLGWLAHHMASSRGPAAPGQQVSQPVMSATRPAPPPSSAQAAAAPVTEIATLRPPARRRRTTSAQTAVQPEVQPQGLPEVLIDKSEQEGIVRLYTAIQNGRVNLVSLMAVPPGFERQADGSLVPALLEIEPLEKPSDTDTGAGSTEPGPSQ